MPALSSSQPSLRRAEGNRILAHKGDFGSYAIFYQGLRYAILMRVKDLTMVIDSVALMVFLSWFLVAACSPDARIESM